MDIGHEAPMIAVPARPRLTREDALALERAAHELAAFRERGCTDQEILSYLRREKSR